MAYCPIGITKYPRRAIVTIFIRVAPRRSEPGGSVASRFSPGLSAGRDHAIRPRTSRTAPVVHDIAPSLTATPRERIRGSSTPYLHTTAGRRAMSLTDRATVRLRRDRDGAGPAPGRQHATRPKAPPRPRPRGGAPVPLAVALRTGRDWRPHRHLTATALPRLRTSRGHGHDPRGTAHTQRSHLPATNPGNSGTHSETVVRHGPRRATTHGVPPTHDVPPRATAEIPPR